MKKKTDRAIFEEELNRIFPSLCPPARCGLDYYGLTQYIYEGWKMRRRRFEKKKRQTTTLDLN